MCTKNFREAGKKRNFGIRQEMFLLLNREKYVISILFNSIVFKEHILCIFLCDVLYESKTGGNFYV